MEESGKNITIIVPIGAIVILVKYLKIVLKLFQLLDSELLDVRLPYVGWHPCRCIGRLGHLPALSKE